MKKYHLFLEKEKKITELNSINSIWRHPYISLETETAAKEKSLLEKIDFNKFLKNKSLF